MWENWQARETVLKTSQISSLTSTIVFYLSELAFKFPQIIHGVIRKII